jgi:recombination protein RecR
MNLPKSMQNVSDAFASLPGIGPKSANRLAFYLLRIPKEDVLRFSDALRDLKEKTQICERCFNVGDSALCNVCSDHTRDNSTICVVETPLDLIAIDKSGYKGVYHVLHGVINPMAGIGPDEIFISPLLKRIRDAKADDNKIKEIILATSTSLEGESTCMYINKEIHKEFDSEISVTRIGKGLPIGADIEYTDERTINDALSGRVSYN